MKHVFHTKRNKIAMLDVRTWIGTSAIGAKHYYGRIIFNDGTNKDDHSIERTIDSDKEATELNRDDSGAGYKKGDATTRFDDLESLREKARQLWRSLYPDAVALLESDSCSLDPSLMLDGPPELMAELNAIVARCEANDWWEGDEKVMEALSNSWNQLIEDKL